jgi:hypothetical protein
MLPRADLGHHGSILITAEGCRGTVAQPLDTIRRPRNTPIWKLEPPPKCRSCRTPRYAPPVHVTRLTETREIAPYVWVHPDDDDRR